MKMWKTILAAAALALASSSAAFAARTDLVLGIVLEPPHLDPTAGAAAAIDEIVYANVFEGLTRIGARGEVLPDLAESWTVSDDGKVYTFKLHTGVKFHDGTDFNADDVKFSLDRARADNSTNAQKGLFAAIDSVEVVDPATVKVTLKNPQGLLPLQSRLGRCGDRRAGDRRNQQGQAGRHRAVQVRPLEQGLGDHHRQGRRLLGRPGVPRQGRVPHRAGRGRRRSRAAVGRRAGVPVLSGRDAVAQIQADPRFKVVVGSTEGETILSTNNKKPPFDNLKVRQAIAHALDRKAIIDGGVGGLRHADRLAFLARQRRLCRSDRHLSA